MGEVGDARVRRLGVEVVVVGHLLAVVQDGAADAGALRLGEGRVRVHRRGLVRVLAVAQRVHEGHGHGALGRGRALADLAPQVLGHHRVVRRAVLVRLPGERLAHARVLLVGAVFVREVVQQRLVVRGVHEHVHERVVLRGGADHRRAADVDVLHARREVGARSHRLAERVEVDGDDVDVPDVVLLHGGDVRVHVPAREDAAVHGGVQRLDAPVQHLGEIRHLVHRGHSTPAASSGFRGPPGADHLVPELRQARGEIGHAGLVGDGDQRAGLSAVGGGVLGGGRGRHDAAASRAGGGDARTCDGRRMIG